MSDVAISPAAMRIIKLLVGKPPQTVADLIEATQVTRTAVTEQLNELVAAGLVERRMQRLPGRGRPRHVYSATTSALLLVYTESQRLVLPSIWRAIHEVGGRELAEQIIQSVSKRLVEHYSRRITAKSPKERLEQFVHILREEGGLLELEEENGQLKLKQRSCPFIIMFEENRSSCLLDIQIMESVIGAPVKQIASRHDGDPCCEFTLANKRGPSAQQP